MCLCPQSSIPCSCCCVIRNLVDYYTELGYNRHLYLQWQTKTPKTTITRRPLLLSAYKQSDNFSGPGKVKVAVEPLKVSYNWDVGGGYHGEEGLGHTKLFRLQQMV
jgi:hypothetical protein